MNLRSTVTLLVLALLASPLFAAAGASRVGQLTCRVPAGGGAFVIHGTMPIPPRAFTRSTCPFTVKDPSGQPLATQWELVARLKDYDIIELRALVPQNTWSGKRVFPVVQRTSAQNLRRFDPTALAMGIDPNGIRLRLRDQSGKPTLLPVSGFGPLTRFHRLGVATITVENRYETPFGGFQVWITANARSPVLEVILNWHNGGLPAKPDVYFRSLELVLAKGWSFTPLLPDPSFSGSYLVKPDAHVLPQRMERSFRFFVHPNGTTPDVSKAGFAVGDWSGGGYMPQAIALPDLSHVQIDLTTQKNDDFRRLANTLATAPGQPPVNFLWPAQGVYYGGMASGTEIDQFYAIPLAVDGHPDGLLSLYVEQLRYASRQPGCIYERGDPIELDDYLNGNGTMPWVLFNSTFYGNPPQDTPFFFSRTGPGNGSASYDPTIFLPIDSQHLVRRTKANKALLWLDNDPLARLYVTMDAELARMSYYEGPGGLLKIPAVPGQGIEMGRGEAWMGDVMATAFAISDDAWRTRTAAWFLTYATALHTAQLPSGLFSAIDHGKIAVEPPYGNGSVAFYKAHRSNEQAFLILALRGLQEVGGIPSHDAIRRVAEGLWAYAWKPGTSGPLERYPVGPVGGAPWATRAQIPAGLTSSVAPDAYQIGTALAFGFDEGAAGMLPAILAWTKTQDLVSAKAQMEAWGLTNIANRAPVLTALQTLLP